MSWLPTAFHYALRIAQYAVVQRVPLVAALSVLLLVYAAFLTSAKSLLKGLFEVTPLSMLTVSLAAGAAGQTVAVTARIAWFHAWERVPGLSRLAVPPEWLWIAILTVIGGTVVIAAAVFSCYQIAVTTGNVLRQAAVIAAAAAGLALWIFLAIDKVGSGEIVARFIPASWLGYVHDFLLSHKDAFAGYAASTVNASDDSAWNDQIAATNAFILAVLLYGIVGLYGRWQLGKRRTVPALAAPLMLIVLLCWALAGIAFFLDRWHIPVLSVIALLGVLTAQSSKSDHYYDLKEGAGAHAGSPAHIIGDTERLVVVAANGGGIQAAAWTAQVLEGLYEEVPRFGESLRMISSVSGGSVGSICFLYWLTDKKRAKDPATAAAESSLDEVAWGLAWPDFLRGVCPWLFGFLAPIGRGRAIEKAWCLNAAARLEHGSALDQPLSNWNHIASCGKMPAIIMNATIVETGKRLLLGTTHPATSATAGEALVDATVLHTIDGVRQDVGIVTAARLSATFPYVTPASRAKASPPMPHIVDGGYYDDYGMATLVEWLDEALTTHAIPQRRVLVLQIRETRVERDPEKTSYSTRRGWFFQAFAPLLALFNVRGEAQIAHNDIELTFLQQKWEKLGVPIESVKFEFPKTTAPLSWHLTATEVKEIRDAWDEDPTVGTSRAAVSNFFHVSPQRR
jgi:hypothetical protein